MEPNLSARRNLLLFFFRFRIHNTVHLRIFWEFILKRNDIAAVDQQAVSGRSVRDALLLFLGQMLGIRKNHAIFRRLRQQIHKLTVGENTLCHCGSAR